MYVCYLACAAYLCSSSLYDSFRYNKKRLFAFGCPRTTHVAKRVYAVPYSCTATYQTMLRQRNVSLEARVTDFSDKQQIFPLPIGRGSQCRGNNSPPFQFPKPNSPYLLIFIDVDMAMVHSTLIG